MRSQNSKALIRQQTGKRLLKVQCLILNVCKSLSYSGPVPWRLGSLVRCTYWFQCRTNSSRTLLGIESVAGSRQSATCTGQATMLAQWCTAVANLRTLSILKSLKTTFSTSTKCVKCLKPTLRLHSLRGCRFLAPDQTRLSNKTSNKSTQKET